MNRLLVFSSEDNEYQFSSIVKHRWKNKSPGQILAEHCSKKLYDTVTHCVGTYIDNIEAILQELTTPADIFFFVDFSTTQIPNEIFEVLNKKVKNSNLFFCCHFEPYTVLSFKHLSESILKNNPNTKNVYYISNNAKVFEIEKPSNINVAFFDFFSGYYVDGLKDFETESINFIPNRIEQKDFLCLNLKRRLTRTYFVELLKKNQVFDNGYVSYGNENTIDKVKILNDDVNLLGKSNVVHPTFSNINAWARHVYFEIVMEDVHFSFKGVEDEDFVCLSEKIYRAIYNKLPFIVYGKLDYLKYLRSMGFKTYEGLFDESYDDIRDWQSRGRYIVKQVVKFCQKTNIEKEAWHKQAREIAEYNYQHLLKDENICRIFADKFL